MTRSISFGVDPLGAVGPAFWKSPPPHRPAAGEYRTGNPRHLPRSDVRPRFAPDRIPMINMHPMYRAGQLDRNALPPGVTFATNVRGFEIPVAPRLP